MRRALRLAALALLSVFVLTTQAQSKPVHCHRGYVRHRHRCVKVKPKRKLAPKRAPATHVESEEERWARSWREYRERNRVQPSPPFAFPGPPSPPPPPASVGKIATRVTVSGPATCKRNPLPETEKAYETCAEVRLPEATVTPTPTTGNSYLACELQYRSGAVWVTASSTPLLIDVTQIDSGGWRALCYFSGDQAYERSEALAVLDLVG